VSGVNEVGSLADKMQAARQAGRYLFVPGTFDGWNCRAVDGSGAYMRVEPSQNGSGWFWEANTQDDGRSDSGSSASRNDAILECIVALQQAGLDMDVFPTESVVNAKMSIPDESVPSFALQFKDADRYTTPVESSLVLFLPKTYFRPEAMRVSQRESESGKWFEVETYNPGRERWIDQKSYADLKTAVNDAVDWYPDPAQAKTAAQVVARGSDSVPELVGMQRGALDSLYATRDEILSLPRHQTPQGEMIRYEDVARLSGAQYVPTEPEAMRPAAFGVAEPKTSAVTVDTSTFRKLTYEYAEAIMHGSVPQTSKAWEALVAHVDAGYAVHAAPRAAAPDFEAVADKRMSELSPQQQDDARELWLRKQIGSFGEESARHLKFLLDRLDTARAPSPADVLRSRVQSWESGREALNLIEGKELAEVAMHKLGLPAPAWRRSVNYAPEHAWEYADVIMDHGKMVVGASSGGVVSIDGSPFTPKDKVMNISLVPVEESMRARVAQLLVQVGPSVVPAPAEAGYVLAFPGASDAEGDELIESLRAAGNVVHKVPTAIAAVALQEVEITPESERHIDGLQP